MRIFILTIMLFYSCSNRNSNNPEYIKIEHVGPSDKPIATIIVSTNDLPKEDWVKVIIVDESSFNKIYGFVSQIKADLNLKDGKVDFQEWEVFRITCSSAQSSVIFITSKKTESIACFTQLIDKLQPIENQEGVRKFIHELQILLKRIG